MGFASRCYLSFPDGTVIELRVWISNSLCGRCPLSEADVAEFICSVRFVPKADIPTAATALSRHWTMKSITAA